MDKISKEFRPMMCPICDEMYFSGPNDNSNGEDLAKYIKGDVQCSHCGWIYDLFQAEHPDSKNGFNKMSVNEYKKWFKDKIKENPKYDYFDENMPKPTPHKCPICGEYEFTNELSSDICPICGWEDTGFENIPDEKPSEYMMSFNERSLWFKEKRKNNPKYKWIKDEK